MDSRFRGNDENKAEEEMKTSKGNGRRVIRTVLACLALVLVAGIAVSEEPSLFQINLLSDSVADLSKYVDGAVSAVTGDLGAPSAVWFSPSDTTLIDYIYIGDSVVITFHVLREGKTVSNQESKLRSEWENSVCLKYKDCPVGK